MSVTLNLYDRGQAAPLSTLTSTLAWFGVSSAGVANTVYAFDAPGVIPTNVGYGPGPEGVAAGVRVSQTRQVFVKVDGSIPGTVSAVAQSGTGPLFAIAGTPYDSATPSLVITRGGALGTAQFQLAMDGGTYGPVTDTPTRLSASTVGTGDLSALTYSALDTLTLIVTPTNGTVETVTFSSTTSTNFLTQINAVVGPAKVTGSVSLSGFTYSTLDTLTLIFRPTNATVDLTVTFASTNSGNFLTQINTALGATATASVVSNHLVVTDAVTGVTSTLIVGAGTANSALGLTAGTFYGAQASIVQGRYLKIVDGAVGTSSTLTVGAGTANTLLGLTAGANTGANATYEIPLTGLTLTFPAGTYVKDEGYAWTMTEPRFTVSDIASAITALQVSNTYFRDMVVLCNPIDGVDTRAFAAQLSTSLTTLRGALPKVFAVAMMSSSIGLTGDVNANDVDVKTAMQGQVDPYVTVAHGDCYMQGTSLSGSFRRPAVFSLGIRAAAYPISSDPGNREQPQLEETSMVSADLTTAARNEDTAVTKMQSAGFTVLRNDVGSPYFVQGLTRGNPQATPKFYYLPIMRTAVEAARILYVASRRYENANRFANPNGTIRESDGVAIEQSIQDDLITALGNDISAAIVTVDRAINIVRTNTLSIRADIQPLGYFYTVIVNAGVVDVIT